jgi:hypothetical protein
MSKSQEHADVIRAGRDARANNKEMNANPHAIGTDAYESWELGWMIENVRVV